MIITLVIEDKESADLLEKAIGEVGLAIVEDTYFSYPTYVLKRIPEAIAVRSRRTVAQVGADLT